MVETKTWVMNLEAGGRSQKTRHAGGLWKLQNSKKGCSPWSLQKKQPCEANYRLLISRVGGE